MPTKIFCVDITLGDPPNQVFLKNEVCKKLPTHILQSNAYFIKWLKGKIGKSKADGEKIWNSLTNKKTKMVPIKINFKKELSNINQEPIIGEYE